MSVPEKNSMTVTYSNLDWSETWQGCARLQNPQLNKIVAMVWFLAFSLMFVLLDKLCGIYVSAIIRLFLSSCLAAAVMPFLIALNTVLVFLAVKIGLPCHTTIASEGIIEHTGFFSVTFPWQKINAIERIGNILYFRTARGGIYVPVSAFNDAQEADEFYALAVKHKAQNSSAKIAPAASTAANTAALTSHVPDPDFVLKSIQAEEERLWKVIEQKHHEAQGQNEKS